MRRRLDAAELADAAVSAALLLGLLTTGRLLAAGTFFQVMGTVVMAVLAARRRLRAAAVATVASMSMAVLLGGIGPVGQAFVAGLFGAAGGVALRRRCGLLRHVLLTLAVAWPIVAGTTVGFLAVFGEARELSFENGRNQWLGFARVLESLGASSAADTGTEFVDWSIDHWWLMVPALQLGISVGYALIVRRLGRAVLGRVDRALGEPWHPPPDRDEAVAPLPVLVGTVRIERDQGRIHLPRLGERIGPGDRVVLLGGNGAGKTSLVESLAGLHRADGIARNGGPGLGTTGGTALIGQAPEAQVVGLRVLDDLRWGLDGEDPDRLRHHLVAVGLGGREGQPTSQLSGGELQRLAIAAALARRPALLLSDESTAMLDPPGRGAVVDLLAGLPEHTAVVHTTHDPDEVSRFDRVVELAGGGREKAEWRPRTHRSETVVLSMRDVGYVHDIGSPWAARALDGVSFDARRGDLVVVRGANGSGKTTLVRLLAGLTTPTEGEIRFLGEPLTGPTGDIGVTFQHARHQLLRPTVGQEIASLAGSDDLRRLDQALAFAGFDPRTAPSQRVAALSGGQQRRLLLAGISARQCDLVVLDEPLAGLDESGRARLTALVDELLARGTAVVVVSHDPQWALDRATALVDLGAGERVAS